MGEGVSVRHLKLANGGVFSSAGLPSTQLCYIFIDWGDCDSVDQCGFDFGDCPGKDVCLIDY
jgi:hypothetical protein